MPYTINKTNGVVLTVVQDGTINNSAADLVFTGKNYTGYGENLNENFVKLLENFANNTVPKKPLVGQLWYDLKNKKIKIYNGSAFKPLGVIEVSAGKPVGSNQGDLWYNINDKRVYVNDGSTYTFVGASTNVTGGIESIINSYSTSLANGTSQSLVTQTVNGTTVSILSNNPITISSTATTIGNSIFPQKITQGINLPNNFGYIDGITATGSNNQGYLFNGTAASALGLVDVLTQPPSLVSVDQLARKNDPNPFGNIPFVIDSDGNITVGRTGIIKIGANSTDGYISNIKGQTIYFNVTDVSNALKEVFRITSVPSLQILPNANQLPVAFGSSTNRWDYIYSSNINSTNSRISLFTATNATLGTVLISNSTIANTNITDANITNASISNLTAGVSPANVYGTWNLANGAVFQATYADIAERYHADQNYDPGTVLVIGGEYEVTTTDIHGNSCVAGIVSTNPAFALNSEAGDNATHPNIALKGRVPCNVVGPISKGDLLVTANKPGFAERMISMDNPNAVLAIALEDFTGTTGTIEVMVK
jgi:hypothetical protein